jgi:hypothetical protein
MTVFQNYFDAMGDAIRVTVVNKAKREIKVVTLKVAGRMLHVSIGDLVEEMRVNSTYEDQYFEVHFFPKDNGPEHMPKRI